MRIGVFTHFFPPEPCAASNRAIALCRGLRDAGHEVTVFTGFPSFPSGTIPTRYRRLLYARECFEDMQVVRVWTYAKPGGGAASRLLNWFSTAAGSTVAALTGSLKADAVLVTCPPITLALPALCAATRWRARLLVDVRDAFPDVAVKAGLWKPGAPLTLIVGAVARSLYRRADAISCVTQSVCGEVAARGDVGEKTFLAPNGFDAVQSDPAPAFERSEREFAVAFAGNIGITTHLDVVLDAAGQLRGRPNIKFRIAGDGSDFGRLQAVVKAKQLANVELLGAVERAKAISLLRDSDLCLVTLRAGIEDSVPTKMFDALYAGCPVLLSGGGEARAFIERSHGGWSVPPEDSEALASCIAALSERREECSRAGEAGKSYVVRFSSREDAVARVVSAVERSSATIPNKSHAYL